MVGGGSHVRGWMCRRVVGGGAVMGVFPPGRSPAVGGPRGKQCVRPVLAHGG